MGKKPPLPPIEPPGWMAGEAVEASASALPEPDRARLAARAGERLETWATQGDTATPISRAQALEDVRAEAAELGVTIETGPDAEGFLDHSARVEGVPPESRLAVALGDVVFVRESHVDDPRTLREEVIHTQQQLAGMEVSREAVTRGEIEARELMLQNQNRWGITEAEAEEIREDLRKIEERGGY